MGRLPANWPRTVTTESGDELLPLSVAAPLAGVSKWTLRRRVEDGSLPAYRVGKQAIRVRRRDVEALLRPIPSASAR